MDGLAFALLAFTCLVFGLGAWTGANLMETKKEEESIRKDIEIVSLKALQEMQRLTIQRMFNQLTNVETNFEKIKASVEKSAVNN